MSRFSRPWTRPKVNMKVVRILMGMPVTIEVLDPHIKRGDIDKIYDYFDYVDHKFSTYKDDSEVSKINQGFIEENKYSKDMKEVLRKSEETKLLTNGHFDVYHKGSLDPSGLVKGWAIYNAAKKLKKMGYKNFYVDAGSDIQIYGNGKNAKPWRVGIKNPFNELEIVKTLYLKNKGIATSGVYIRGFHIYNPHDSKAEIGREVASLTVIGANIYEADRFATAAYAMGREGILFLERQKDLEAYMIDSSGIATFTSGFEKYLSS